MFVADGDVYLTPVEYQPGANLCSFQDDVVATSSASSPIIVTDRFPFITKSDEDNKNYLVMTLSMNYNG